MAATHVSSTHRKRAIEDLAMTDEKPREVEVLVLGLSRTGTFSMYKALDTLGYKTYHMTEAWMNYKAGHFACWRDALFRKYYNQEGQYGKAEFQKFLGKYNALTDAPCVNFSDELLKAYPAAKVVLVNRDPAKWLQSMKRSYYAIVKSRLWRLTASLDSAVIGPYNDMLKLILSFWTQGHPMEPERLLEGYSNHYSHIRSVVPSSRLLEYTLEDGWEPLCQYLGKPVPNVPYPHENVGSYTADMHLEIMYFRLFKVGGKWAALAAAGIAALLAIWWKWQR